MLGLVASVSVRAGVTDLSTTPISSNQSATVKPNLMLLMDTSTSMGYTHMPDDAETSYLDAQSVGYRSSQCNSLYFNPDVTYVLPKVVDTTAVGLPLVDAPAPSFSAAPFDFYGSSGTMVNLSTSFQAFTDQSRAGVGQATTAANRSDTPQAAYYYVYSGTAALNYAGKDEPHSVRSPSPCDDPVGTTTTTGGTWTKFLVNGAQQTNFAIWYTYYRTRMALVKSGIGRALAGIDDKFRVGFISASPLPENPLGPNYPLVAGAEVQRSKYQPIGDFDATQRSALYAKMYGQVARGASPMREALARVGRHYSDYGAHLNGTSLNRSEGINAGMPEDPVQHSCQRNYTIMTTDGYWNKTYETVGPVKMDGVTLVGEQDSPLTGTGLTEYSPHPMFDGGATGFYTEQRQNYDYQILNCSSGNSVKSVYLNTQRSETYTMLTQGQFRETQTPTRTTRTTTTQTASSTASTEPIAYLGQSVTQSTQRTTIATLSTSNRTQTTTQVVRNDTQQIMTYEYVRQTTQTASKTVTTATVMVSQLVAVAVDGSRYFLSVCDALALQRGCGPSSSATLQPVAVDPGDATVCFNQIGSATNDWKTVTCTMTTQTTAIAPSDPCVGTGNVLVQTANGPARQSCTATASISYVGSKSKAPCQPTNGAGLTQIFCSSVLAPVLNSPALPSGSSTANCASSASTSANLSLPADATTGTTNTYSIVCKTIAVSAPTGAVIVNSNSQQYAVDPATCVGATANGKTTKGANGLSTTCTLVTSATTPIVFNSCGACTNVAATAPNWVATTYNTTSSTATYVSLATCPSTATTDMATSPYTHSVCTLISDTSAFVDTATCVAGPIQVGNAFVTCVTVPISPTTPVAACGATGFNVPLAGQTSACSLVKTTINSCKHPELTGAQTYYDPVTFITYSACTTLTTLGIPVPVNSCVAGATTAPPKGYPTTAVYTCDAPTVVTEFLPPSPPCSTAGSSSMQVITCSFENALQLQKKGVAIPYVDCGAAVVPPAVASGVTLDPVSGVAVTCSGASVNGGNSWNSWVKENVGTACTGANQKVINLGWGPTYSFVTYVDATGMVNTCAFSNDTHTAFNTCVPGGPTDKTNPQVWQTCTGMTTTAPVPAANCVPGFTSQKDANGVEILTAAGDPIYSNTVCESTLQSTAIVPAGQCSPNMVPAAPDFTTTTCTPDLDSWQKQFRVTTSTWTQSMSGARATGPISQVAAGVPGAWQNMGACTSAASQPRPATPIASVEASLAVPPIAPVGIINTDVALDKTSVSSACVSWPCRGYTQGSSAGSENSLADVAQYYYVTDLRADMADDLTLPNLAASHWEDDRAAHQHMTTFVVGLGVSGMLAFDPNYRNLSNTRGDFPAIRAGTLDWPAWPTPAVAASNLVSAYSDPRSIDDFWHAAVNGRGEYFSATDPYSMVSSIQSALNGINALIGAGSGATSSTATPNSQDNTVFVPSYKDKAWSGDVQAMAFDLSTGTIAPTADTWSAQTELDKQAIADFTARKIVMRKSGASALTVGDNLALFDWGNLSAAQQSYFDATVMPLWGQTTLMNPAQKTSASGVNLVNFLRGDRSLEDFAPGYANKLYRKRDHVLGDIVGSQPTYVKGPTSSYVDSGYSAFKSSAAGRKKMIYVGANDGMLHAFYAPTAADANWLDRGKEAWAYIPSQVLPLMHKLADISYSSNHQFMVDGTAVVGDVYDKTAGQWRTILVGGLNTGGSGYYALDVTDPDAPKSLWEFSTVQDANVGKSYGRPIITKLTSGAWVVMFTSGYNNADGKGYLYVRNAIDGSLVKTISTAAGTATQPSGLREINNWVNNGSLDNTTQRVYGGDLLGNVWRFDVNGTTGATKLATLTTSAGLSGVAQPITTRVELAEIGGDPYVYVGTGRLLGASDLADTTLQSVYSFKDLVYANGDVRSTLKPMAFSGTVAAGARTLSCAGSPTSCAQKTGWVIDLPESGERMNIDFRAAKGTLIFVTNVPASVYCYDGHSWLNYLDMVSGAQIAGTSAGSVLLDANSLAVGLGVVEVASPDGPKLKAIGVSARAQVAVKDIPWGSTPPAGKRVSWREVVK